MGKFSVSKRAKKDTMNYMGAKAYRYPEKFELVSLLLTSFAEDTYYETSKESRNRLQTVMHQIKDVEFLAKATLYARKVFNMRSITHIMASELAPRLSGTPFASIFYDKIVVRLDDMTEILAYHWSKKQKMSNAMRKGFAKAFNRFDGYQLAKYRGSKNEVKLVDLVNLVRPKPTPNNEKVLTDLVNGTLKNKNTWEARLSKAGQNASSKEAKDTAKKEAWEGLIMEQRIGYMALLRNLRNILQSNIDVKALDKALSFLTNPKAIKNSKQLPFRFLSAYAEMEAWGKGKSSEKTLVFEKDNPSKELVEKVLEALEKAVNISINSLPLLKGETVILSDNSGSMRGDSAGRSAISAMSKRKTSDIANLFATMYWKRSDNTLIGLFGDKLLMPKLDRRDGIFECFKKIDTLGSKVGPGTEAGIFEMFERLIKERRKVARIVVFSDMQIGKGCTFYDKKGRSGADFNKLFENYLKIHPDVKVYTIDLRGYGTTVFKKNMYKLAGWSEKIFDLMDAVEQDEDALFRAIEKIEL